MEEAAKEKLRKEQEKLKRKGAKSNNSMVTSLDEGEDKTQQDGEVGDESKKGSDKDEAEEDEDDGDEYCYRVFYKKEEIRMSNAMQNRDTFEDLISMRYMTNIENSENPQVNKFNIMDFTPREKSPVNNLAKSKKLTKSGIAKKAIKGFDDEDEDDPNFDEFLADFEKNKKHVDEAQMTEIKLHELEKTNLE